MVAYNSLYMQIILLHDMNIKEKLEKMYIGENVHKSVIESSQNLEHVILFSIFHGAVCSHAYFELPSTQKPKRVEKFENRFYDKRVVIVCH